MQAKYVVQSLHNSISTISYKCMPSDVPGSGSTLIAIGLCRLYTCILHNYPVQLHVYAFPEKTMMQHNSAIITHLGYSNLLLHTPAER